jgi:hypothetical protein
VLPREEQQEQGLYRDFEIDHEESPGGGMGREGSPFLADSDEAAQAFRDDGAWYSDMMSPRARSLAGW